MTPSLFTCTWLLLPYCVLVTLSTGELEFYQDGIPETPEDIALRQFARLLEAQSHQHHPSQRTRLSPFLLKPAHKKHRPELDRENERNPFTAIDKNLADILRQEKLGEWNYRQRYNDPVNGMPRQREYDLPYYEVNPLGRGFNEPWIKLPSYFPFKQDDERSNLKNEDLEYPRDLASSKHSFHDRMGLTISKGMKEGPMVDYPGNFGMPIDEEGVKNDDRKLKQSANTEPEFTFKFDDSNLSEKHPFAVKPNDPRYYQDTPFSSDMNEMEDEPKPMYHGNLETRVNEDPAEDEKRDLQKPATGEPEFTYQFDESNLSEQHPFAVKPNDPRYYQDAPFSEADGKTLTTLNNDTKWENAETTIEKDHAAGEHEESTNNVVRQFQGRSMVTLPEPERRTGYHPLIVPVTHHLNSDIYFIAIVAGCSAAAMFALVLISLTWCRLQRGAKAAADIEYPAYGVTGPNKDVSPSGDQRLAQSAQMYHFQHQKQQIIAMENRTSATRDPGSVSEAESDEENEEGDYTVYECPGLASTGEMEVKNPLFHDDPTPATPAQSNKEEDHI